MQTYQVHNQTRGYADGDALEGILYHKPRADLVYRQGLQGVLERTDPLQPTEDWWDSVEVHEESGKRHLV